MALLRLIPLLLILLCTGCGTTAALPSHETVIIDNETWTLELAMDDDSIRRGLMERTALADREGMLFIFPDSQPRSFWMANCLIDIDLIYLDDRGTITAVHEMQIEPPRETDESQFGYESRLTNYRSVYPARFAIELPSGSISRLELKPNQRLSIDLERLKSLRNRADRSRGG